MRSSLSTLSSAELQLALHRVAIVCFSFPLLPRDHAYLGSGWCTALFCQERSWMKEKCRCLLGSQTFARTGGSASVASSSSSHSPFQYSEGGGVVIGRGVSSGLNFKLTWSLVILWWSFRDEYTICIEGALRGSLQNIYNHPSPLLPALC